VYSANQPTALVVDDDPFIRMNACVILEEAGFNCLEACDGDEAWELVETGAADLTLLFTDVEMPGAINGFELARLVADRRPNVEIVVASGRVSPQESDLPPKATFIGKPFSAQVVHDHLRATLPDEKQPAPLRSQD
jgi:CheY-like chemotaxis protein